MTVVFAADGQQNPARGVLGGGDGNTGELNVIGTDGQVSRAPSVGQIELQQGEWLNGIDLAGGGYGNPLEREVELVQEDVMERYISIEHASRIYGVEFTGRLEDESLAVDAEATAARRAALSAAP